MKLSISNAILHISNINLQTIIGVNEWERKNKQNVVINVFIEYDHHKAISTDSLSQALDYSILTENIKKAVNSSSCFLLETLAHHVLQTILIENKSLFAKVIIDKPCALHSADSVSVESCAKKEM